MSTQASRAEPRTAPSYAAGVRMLYADLPPALHRWVADQVPGPITEIIDRRGGFSPGATATVRCADGRGVFVKAVSDAVNTDSLRMYRNERDRGLRLPRLPGILKPSGSVELRIDEQQWIAVTFPIIDGRPPVHPWTAADAVRCLDLVDRLGAELTPSPWPDDSAATRGLIDFFTGWQRLAQDPGAPWRSDPWIVERLPDLLAEEKELAAALPGNTLSHTDLRADNIMIAHDGTPWFVDWAHSRNVARWVDAVLLIADIAASGADPADVGTVDVPALLDHPACAGAPLRIKIAVLSGLAAALQMASVKPPPPGLPTIRGWQRLTSNALLGFVRRVHA